MILPLLLTIAAPADGTVVIEPSTRYQAIDGYGQGSMDQRTVPWFTQLDEAERERLLDQLYTLDGDGLGLTICRTWLCASDAPGHAHMGRHPGGSKNPLGYAPEPGVWQWDGHEPSLWHARGAAQRGARMVAFFNGPPWWLTISGCSAGAPKGGDNLKPGSETAYAEYMAEVVQHCRDSYGVPFTDVCPINEPETNYWEVNGGQDGCGMNARQAGAVVVALRHELDRRGLALRILGPELSHTTRLDWLEAFLAVPGVTESLAEITCHQYTTSFHSMRQWPTIAALLGKPLWQSEWGDWKNHGAKLAMNYAHKIAEAHRVMQAAVWCMWEPGFLVDQQDGHLVPNQAWHTVAQYTRFARPGMRVIEATDTVAETTAYLDETARQIVIITRHGGEQSITLRYDLSAFEGLGEVASWRTSDGEALAAQPAFKAEDGFAATLPPQSVTTFRATYQRLVPPLVRNGGFERGVDGWTGEPEALTGVQANYPQGGSHDGFIDLQPGRTGQLSQRVDGLTPGAHYRLTAACASSDIPATLAVEGAGLAAASVAQGGRYRLTTVEFRAPANGRATIQYSAGPVETAGQWATIDNVRLSPRS